MTQKKPFTKEDIDFADYLAIKSKLTVEDIASVSKKVNATATKRFLTS